jgi:DNA-binding HxlR family transcriptional regulator/putative sterol carrier protein
MTSKRSYHQFCPVARGLDVIGERWTVLVARELMFGPRRFTDLQQGLPGIGPNVLAERLRSLQDAAVVRRTKLPPPAASTVYEFTELGEDLKPLLREMFRWGLNFIGAPRADDSFRLSWTLGAMRASVRPGAGRGVREAYEFRVADEVFHVRVDDGEVEVEQGPAEDPAFVWTGDIETLLEIGTRQITPADALAREGVSFEGDTEAGARALDIFASGLLEPVPAR